MEVLSPSNQGDELKKELQQLLSMVSDSPQEIEIVTHVMGSRIYFEIHAGEQTKLIIGSKGKNINAIRGIMEISCNKRRRHYNSPYIQIDINVISIKN